MKRFIPNSQFERHHKYFDAFEIQNGISDINYLNFITEYINDTSLSPNNDDDLEFFKNLLFESIKGKVHIRYYDWVITNLINNDIHTCTKILSRYSEYLGGLSNLFLHDFFNYLLQLDDKQIIIELFNVLPSKIKLEFIYWANDNESVVKLIPKLKSYLLFS